MQSTMCVCVLADGYVMMLSHWPHVAEQVQQQVAELVAELVSSVNGSIEKHGHILGHKFSNKLLYLLIG